MDNNCADVDNSLPRDRNAEQGHIFKINFIFWIPDAFIWLYLRTVRHNGLYGPQTVSLSHRDHPSAFGVTFLLVIIPFIPLLKTWSFGTVQDPATRESETFGSAGMSSRKNAGVRIQNLYNCRALWTRVSTPMLLHMISWANLQTVRYNGL